MHILVLAAFKSFCLLGFVFHFQQFDYNVCGSGFSWVYLLWPSWIYRFMSFTNYFSNYFFKQFFSTLCFFSSSGTLMVWTFAIFYCLTGTLGSIHFLLQSFLHIISNDQFWSSLSLPSVISFHYWAHPVTFKCLFLYILILEVPLDSLYLRFLC